MTFLAEESAAESQKEKIESSLQAQFPQATPCECRRFGGAFGRRAAEKLGAYLKWKEDNVQNLEVPAQGDDNADWLDAMCRACNVHHHKDYSDATTTTTAAPGSNTTATSEEIEKAPKEMKKKRLFRRNKRKDGAVMIPEGQVMQTPSSSDENQDDVIRDIDGRPILYVLPAQILLTMPNAVETYTSAFVYYVHRKLKAHGHQFTALIDCRGGRGWPNAPPAHMVGLIRHSAQRLHDLYPGTLLRCIVFPIPSFLVHLWAVVKHFLHPHVRETIVLLSGHSIDNTVDMPYHQLNDYISEDGLRRVEEIRIGHFGPEED